MADDQAALGRLHAIKHIVVLMMENRSFDHMLGYLERAGMPEVEGLAGDEVNLDAQGNRYPVFELGADQTAFHRPGEPLDKSLDPCHSKACVADQLAGGNGGFVRNFIAQKSPPAAQRGLVMGHYTAAELPVYDYLARQYGVCDAWHSSVPGDTWPNRLYALAAREAEKVHPSLIKELAGLLGGGQLKALENAPIYDVPAFTRQLADNQWRWYSHDPATLRAADSHYRDFKHINRDNFAYFDRKKISLLTETAEGLIVTHDGFLDDAAKGELRQVSWIDPNFIDLDILDPNSNDDHPPSDIRAGQALVLDLYEALLATPEWDDTLLVIVYDEHGGFYDHVPPPAINDRSGYATLGVRVPALLVGPRVKKGVCKQVFEHTTLIKTILTRFAANPEAAIRAMGPRVAEAPHLGIALQDQPRTDIADHAQVRAHVDQWRSAARAVRQAPTTGGVSPASDGAGQPLVLHELQAEFARFALAMRHAGLPAGQP